MDNKIKLRALTSQVLAVAMPRWDGWVAYIKAVPGVDHEAEADMVLRNGVKLGESVARAIFPSFDEFKYLP